MRRLLQSLFWLACRWLAKIRYRVRVVGGEKLRELRGPTLVMPNHPGYVDPPMVLSHLRVPGGLRPTVYSGGFKLKPLLPWLRLVDAMEVPDLSEHSRDAQRQTLEFIDRIAAGLERGENFLLYPAGRIQRQGREQIGSNRAAAEILKRCPNVNIVLVRTRGLWGSSFTFARAGRLPNMGRCALRGIALGLANLLFFTPRRTVTMTVEVIDRRTPPGLEREQLNPFLEQWYNQGGLEQPTFVPYHFLFGPREYRFPDLAGGEKLDLARVKPATVAAVRDLIEEHLGRPLEDQEARAETRLDQLGLDSIERMDVALKIEDRFGFRSDRVAETLGELWSLADGQLSADVGPLEVPPAWRRPASTMEPTEILAETLPEGLVRRVLRHPDDVAVADRLSGVLTYRRLLVGAQLMARRLGTLEGDAVGVLLPSSVAADVTFFALHLAGKLPVLLNWTTGPASLAHAVRTLGIRRVVTSRKLIDRLGIEVAGADFVFLENVRAGVGKLESLICLLGSRLFPQRILRRLPRPDPDDPAVVLFTSGSESAPKAVPLSHRNLIANVQASLRILQATRADAILGMLPPFHSFGVMGNLIAPILAGVRMVHHPDPTDAAGLVRVIAAYGVTIAVTTPTFLSYMLGAASADELRSLRIIVTGAEKCPEAVFERCRQQAPQALILEGYGITECSPVVAGNRPGRVKPGSVGAPLDGVEVCVVDPESHQPLPPGARGLLLVRGPSVFSGYLNYDGPDPFLEVGGKPWYVTGDLVEIDGDGYIFFRGRLKRFLKAGGEMISLPALEEPLANRYPAAEQGPQVAVEGIETPEGRHIVLFATQDIPVRQANAILAEAGFRGVMRIDEVVRLDAIPVLGTGKTDYKVLRALVAERTRAGSGGDTPEGP